MGIENLLFVILHPKEALHAKERQLGVAIERSQPPPGSNIEDFPNLSVKQATGLMKKQRENGGVPLSAWPESDQRLMKEGKLPLPGHHPEHTNV